LLNTKEKAGPISSRRWTVFRFCNKKNPATNWFRGIIGYPAFSR